MELHLFDKIYALERARLKALKNGTVPKGAEALYQHPLPKADTPLRELEFASIDFETTGLNFAEDYILSMGGVLMHGAQIDFASGFHCYLRAGDKVKSNSAVINQITPEALISGISPQQALSELIEKLAGRVVICHAAVIERSFILKLLGLRPSFKLPLVFLDTMLLEKSLQSHSGRTEDLRLNAIRERRGFPPYVCHNAFADSVAAAEVFIAQVKEIFGTETPKLGPLYQRCS